MFYYMNVQIIADSDENFKIQTEKFGEQFMASDGERVAIAPTKELAFEEVKGMQEFEDSVYIEPTPAPLENSREGHPFDFFGGTSWAGKRQGFD